MDNAYKKNKKKKLKISKDSVDNNTNTPTDTKWRRWTGMQSVQVSYSFCFSINSKRSEENRASRGVEDWSTYATSLLPSLMNC